MTWYNVLTETNGNAVTDDQFDALESRLNNLNHSVGMNPYGNLSVRVSLDAENLQQAAVLGSSATDEAMRHVGVSGNIVGVSTLTEDEFMRRESA